MSPGLPATAAPAAPAAVTSLDDVSVWVRSSGLEIILLVTGAILLTRALSWISTQINAQMDQQAQEKDALVRSEAAKHRHSVIQVVTWTAIVVIYIVAGVQVIKRLGFPLSGLVAPAAVVGVALGFGAQRVVQDILAGFFIITERQYGFGDVVRISALGATTGVTGTVEDVTLRITRMRSANGEVIIIPNGQIVQVTNQSRDWARAVVDVPVNVAVDLGHLTQILRRVGAEAFADDDLNALLLDEPSVMGVESIDVDSLVIRVVARTLPGKQFEIGRQLRVRIATALRAEGIIVPVGLETSSNGDSSENGAQSATTAEASS
jgi:small-conductance mechanosensitive channel